MTRLREVGVHELAQMEVHAPVDWVVLREGELTCLEQLKEEVCQGLGAAAQ